MSSKICVVVGVGPGLGLAVAKRFGREGYLVALVARRADQLEQYRQELAKAGVEGRPFAADAGDAASLAAAFDAIRDSLGDPEVLIYNAAVLKPGTPSTLAAEELVDAFRVNVAGALVAAQQVLPGMRKQGGGTLLFTGGGLALEPWPQYASLAVGKAGIRSLALSLAKELEPVGLHVATVTICGIIQPGTRFDPDRLADDYWQLHRQPRGKWEREVVVK
ncbi:MAG TPA: SDR family NAD(P)-dependent oxidoreductase [Thermoanaerobaculia bacterium]